MRVYLHSDQAEKSARYVVTIAPAADTAFVGPEMPAAWKLADGTPKQFEIVFSFGLAEPDDEIGRYMVERGIAHKSRMLRKVRQLFDRRGRAIEEIFDADGNRILLDDAATA